MEYAVQVQGALTHAMIGAQGAITRGEEALRPRSRPTPPPVASPAQPSTSETELERVLSKASRVRAPNEKKISSPSPQLIPAPTQAEKPPDCSIRLPRTLLSALESFDESVRGSGAPLPNPFNSRAAFVEALAYRIDTNGTPSVRAHARRVLLLRSHLSLLARLKGLGDSELRDSLSAMEHNVQECDTADRVDAIETAKRAHAYLSRFSARNPRRFTLLPIPSREWPQEEEPPPPIADLNSVWLPQSMCPVKDVQGLLSALPIANELAPMTRHGKALPMLSYHSKADLHALQSLRHDLQVVLLRHSLEEKIGRVLPSLDDDEQSLLRRLRLCHALLVREGKGMCSILRDEISECD